MTNSDLKKLKCYIVSKQHELVILSQYGITCDKADIEADLNEALHIYYSYTICPDDTCELSDLLKNKIKVCTPVLAPCVQSVTISCSSLSIDDEDIPGVPCTSITIQ